MSREENMYRKRRDEQEVRGERESEEKRREGEGVQVTWAGLRPAVECCDVIRGDLVRVPAI